MRKYTKYRHTINYNIQKNNGVIYLINDVFTLFTCAMQISYLPINVCPRKADDCYRTVIRNIEILPFMADIVLVTMERDIGAL